MRGNRFSVAKLTPLEWLRTSSSCGEIEARLARGHHHLRGGGEAHAVEEVVEQLRDVAGPGGAHVVDAARERLEDRAHRVERLRRAAGHDREGPLLGSGRPARDAGVDELDAPLGESGMDSGARAGSRGAEVDDDLPLAGARESSRLAEHDLLDHLTVRQGEEHDVGGGEQGADRRHRVHARAGRLLLAHVEPGDRSAPVTNRRAMRPPMLPRPTMPLVEGRGAAHPTATCPSTRLGSPAASDSSATCRVSSNSRVGN